MSSKQAKKNFILTTNRAIIFSFKTKNSLGTSAPNHFNKFMQVIYNRFLCCVFTVRSDKILQQLPLCYFIGICKKKRHMWGLDIL